MKLVRFRDGDSTLVGEIVDGDTVVPFANVTSLCELLDAEARAGASSTQGEPVPLGEVQLLSPVADARLVLAVGLNYAAHAAESGKELPDFPVVFNKQVGCLNGPFDPVLYPPGIEMLDYEGELAFVVGRRARRVAAGDGLKYIGGYLVMNDVSTRDWQMRSPTLTLGKSFDTHGPTGPCIVTADEIPDPGDLRLRTWVNGELRQDASTSDMIFDCGRIVEIISEMVTLQPGDVITTGTPSGVGLGNSGWFLRVGDVVRVEIEGIGAIENTVVEDTRSDGA
jgi:2-keto-4-pentenoate hydratase/2-oxohepta-3-ene-1,7-dioic acid hydratase in catechol pathway